MFHVRFRHATAAALQTSCAWTVIDVPKVGHDGKLMSAAAAPIVSAVMHGL
jgi:hypothetical protein